MKRKTGLIVKTGIVALQLILFAIQIITGKGFLCIPILLLMILCFSIKTTK